ncbi:MAG: LytR/AlgR family response regulator transcription factor [Candidatus Merdivicinus sp.]
MCKICILAEDHPASERLVESFTNQMATLSGHCYQICSISRKELRDLSEMDLLLIDIKAIPNTPQLQMLSGRVMMVLLHRNEHILPISQLEWFDCFFDLTNSFPDEFQRMLLRYGKKYGRYRMESRGQIVAIPILEICYLDIYNHKISVHTLRGDYAHYGTMDQAESRLQPFGFLRCHRSYLVNMMHIRCFNRAEITLDSGETIGIGSEYRKIVADQYRAYLRRTSIGLEHNETPHNVEGFQ